MQPAMNRFTTLVETPAAFLQTFDHPPATPHRDPEHELATASTVSFVEAGHFAVESGGRTTRLGPGSIFITAPGMTFSCRHDEDLPTDRCLSIAFAERTVEDLRRADLPALEPPVALASRRQRFLQRRLQSCGAGDELRFELLAGSLFASFAAGGEEPRRRGHDGHPRSIARAIDLMEAEFGRPLTLYEIAGSAAMSPFHFARSFRELVGLPPHRFLTAVRLRHAARLLERGMSVTATCFEVGFGSLSHFTRLYQRRFGVAPSATRRRVPAERTPLAAALWGDSAAR